MRWYICSNWFSLIGWAMDEQFLSNHWRKSHALGKASRHYTRNCSQCCLFLVVSKSPDEALNSRTWLLHTKCTPLHTPRLSDGWMWSCIPMTSSDQMVHVFLRNFHASLPTVWYLEAVWANNNIPFLSKAVEHLTCSLI